MASRPTLAFLFSLAGGILTLAAALGGLYAWLTFYSGFDYMSLGLGSVPSAEAIDLFVAGTLCGAAIILGAVLQYSGKKSRVWLGSAVVLVALVASIPTTFFGQVVGGVLSALGVAFGFAWKSPDPAEPAMD